jgi:hypothetical protein
MFRRPGVEIAFQDKSGKSWVRKPLGELLELSVSSLESYFTTGPVNWQTLYNEIPMEPI